MTQIRHNTIQSQWNMNQEGLTHINVHPKSKSELGKLLSNHNESIVVTHPLFGQFKTLTGFWHFLKTGCKFNYYRECSGYEADRRGEKDVKINNPHLINCFRTGILSKFEASPKLLNLFKTNTLPLVAYKIQLDGHERQAVEVATSMIKKQIEFYNCVKGLLEGGRTLEEIKARYDINLFDNFVQTPKPQAAVVNVALNENVNAQDAVKESNAPIIGYDQPVYTGLYEEKQVAQTIGDQLDNVIVNNHGFDPDIYVCKQPAVTPAE